MLVHRNEVKADRLRGTSKPTWNQTPQRHPLGNGRDLLIVAGKTGYDDCLHIATATLCKVNYLVSWNFKHIVNVFRIRGYNSINIKNGLGLLDIRSPKEIVNYGDKD
jgi:hypothetical protein